jgi:hypothetical protein
MSRKHYVEVAEILASATKRAETLEETRVVIEIAVDLAVMFRRDNPAFDSARFYAAISK